LVNHAFGSMTTPAEISDAFATSISGMVASRFVSLASNLVAGQIEPESLPISSSMTVARTVELVSRSAGHPTSTANAESSGRLLSADGRFVAFASQATDLLPVGPMPTTSRIRS